MSVIYCWTSPSLYGLWLICPKLVLILPFLPLWLPFMIPVLGTSAQMSQSCLLSNISVLASVPWICQAGDLSSCLSLWYIFCVSAAYGLNILLCSSEVAYVNISSKHPVPFTICSQWFYFNIIRVLHMFLMLHVINLPIFFTLTMYDYPLWSVLLASTVSPYIHGPPCFHCMTTVYPIGKEIESLWVSLPPLFIFTCF